MLDKDNQLELNNGYVDLNSNELIGSDFNLNFNKETFGNVENDPSLIGRYILVNQSEKTMKKVNSLLVKINLENALLGQYLPMKLKIKKIKKELNKKGHG